MIEKENSLATGSEESVDDESALPIESPRRQQLMKATMECVAEVGVEKTTVWMVAERVGVSTGMVLYYYRNKKELLSSAVAWAGKEFAERLNTVTQGNFGPERLQESMKIFLRDPAGIIPVNFLIQYRMAALNDEDIRQRSLKQYTNSRESLARSVKIAQESGQIRPDVSDYALADLIYTLVNGLAAEIAAHPEIMSLERALDISQLALDAFAAAEDGAPSLSQSASPGPAEAFDSTADQVRKLLIADRRISGPTAESLATAFANLYEIALRESASK